MCPLNPERSSLNSTNNSVGSYDYHVLNCGESEFTKKKIEGTNSSYRDDNDEDSKDEEEFVGEDEIEFYGGTNETKKI